MVVLTSPCCWFSCFSFFFKPTMALSGLSGSQAAAERKKLFRTKSQVMAEEEEQRRQVPRGNRGSRVAVVFTPDLSYKNNVGETKINHWFGKGLYHLFMVIWGILYYCFTHIIQYNFYKYVYCMLWIDMNGYMIANMYRMCIYIYTWLDECTNSMTIGWFLQHIHTYTIVCWTNKCEAK